MQKSDKTKADVADKGGFPLELNLSLIDEDPRQPRVFFDAESLNEMAETIRERGVKTPISVRPNKEQSGRYIINHGARRYRASRIAGKNTIPCFIDADYTEADQVIENLQRDSLTAREIADFIGRELAKGLKKIEIAKKIGKSQSFVSQHVTLLDLPDPISEVFSSGRCRDVTVVNELVTAYKKNAEIVSNWLEADDQEITRGFVKLLRETIEEEKNADFDGEMVDHPQYSDDEDFDGIKDKEKKLLDPSKLKKAIVQVMHNDRPARLVLNRRPSNVGFAWFKYEDDGREFESLITEAHLVAIVEG